jgi:hypothetical protein
MASVAFAQPIHGLLAEFDRVEPLIDVVKAARADGYTKIEGFSPMPVHGLIEALGHKNKLATFVLLGGVIGMLAGFGLEYWVSVIEYPGNVGGRPYYSWPAFVVPMFETTILFASLTAVFGMLVMNGMPQPYHPLFHVDRFAEASRSRFFFLIESDDPRFDLVQTKQWLQKHKPLAVEEVPH